MTERTITLETSHDTLQIGAQTGRLLSLRSKAAPDKRIIRLRLLTLCLTFTRF